MRELDFKREAANMARLATSLRHFKRIQVPAGVSDYTTSRLLVMDYVDGTRIGDLHGAVHVDLPGEELATELFRAYLYQVMVDGMFHADPHPGNVLLTRDRRVALLDVGTVGYFGVEMQESLFKLLLAIGDGRGNDAVDVTLDFSERRADADEAGFRSRLQDLVAIHSDSRLDELRLGPLMMRVCRVAADHGVVVPVELSTLGRALLYLDQVGRALAPRFDPREEIRRYAQELMQLRMNRETSQASLFDGLIETKNLLARLPERTNRILDLVAGNELRVKVDAIDEERLIKSVHKIANRITAGLVIAALIVGASLLMRVETEFRIFGYPGLAAVCFSAAAIGGIALLITIVREDRGSA